MTLYLPAPGNWSGVVNLQAQPAPGNWSEVTFKSEGEGRNSTFCKSSDCRSLEKVFKNLRQKLNLAEEAPVIGIESLKTNVLIW